MNLKELNILLKDVALSRKSVNEYNEGDVYQNLNSGEHKYANINFTINSTQVLSNGVVVVNCYLFYIDRLLEDASNKLDIWTVGANTLNQILNAAKNNSGEFFDFSNLTYTNFTEKFADLCAGVYANVDIQILGNISECDEEYTYREGAWDKGYASGFTDGKLVGYESGLTVGYEQGFEDGVSSMGNYLYLKALSDNAALGMIEENAVEGETFNIQYSSDKIHWTEWDFGEIDVESGETVYFRGYNASGTGIYAHCLRFVTAGMWDCGGDITSLVNGIGGVKNMENTNYGFRFLFKETNIVSAPDISMDYPGYYQYYGTFEHCHYLTEISPLRFQNGILHNGVIRATFADCTSLVQATVVFETLTYADGCCDLFNGCISLSSVTCYIQNIVNYPSATYNWLEHVSPTGVFYNLGNFEFDYDSSGIPSAWTEYVITEKKKIDYKGLTFKSLENNSTIEMINYGGNEPIVQISYDGEMWGAWDYSAITLRKGDVVMFRSDNINDGHFNWDGEYSSFVTSGNVAVKGNIMSLIDGADGSTPIETLSLGDYIFNRLFLNSTGLTDASELILPLIDIAEMYESMFQGCTNLTHAPELPVMEMQFEYEYAYMFAGCTSLVTPPELPATVVYSTSCYEGMFQGCTSLTTAPILPAATIYDWSYRYMFQGCTSLTSVTSYASDISADECLDDWLDGVASSGTFYNLGGANYPSGASGIPTGWTEHT